MRGHLLRKHRSHSLANETKQQVGPTKLTHAGRRGDDRRHPVALPVWRLQCSCADVDIVLLVLMPRPTSLPPVRLHNIRCVLAFLLSGYRTPGQAHEASWPRCSTSLAVRRREPCLILPRRRPSAEDEGEDVGLGLRVLLHHRETEVAPPLMEAEAAAAA